jgi:hypothetical protein
MSRSNPHENGAANPAKRWFEWTGEKGLVRYYDKDKKVNVDVGDDFTFLLLDELGCVRGWHDASDSGIYSNEVKDTRQDVLVVKSFKGGPLAEGLYKDIKDRVNTAGGHFNANCYIAFKDDAGELQIGSIRFKGAALGAWMDFRKEHRSELYKKAVRINGYNEGKKGRVVFRTPVFGLLGVSEETDRVAKGLDAELQEYLTGYLQKNKRDQAEHVARHVSDEDVAAGYDDEQIPPITDEDIPW